MSTPPNTRLLKLVTTIDGAKSVQENHHYVKIIESVLLTEVEADEPKVALYVAIQKEPEERMIRFLEFANSNGIEHGDWEGALVAKHKANESLEGHIIPVIFECSNNHDPSSDPDSDPDGHGIQCSDPEAMKNIHTAWHVIEDHLDHRDCECAICLSLSTIMDFCKPFVMHVDYDAATPLSGTPQVDEAIERVCMINAEIVGRGCCPNFSCRCNHLEKSENLTGGATVGLMVCNKCGFSVKLKKCKHLK